MLGTVTWHILIGLISHALILPSPHTLIHLVKRYIAVGQLLSTQIYNEFPHFNQWSSADPVLNEIDNLGAVKIVCANNSSYIATSINRLHLVSLHI